MIKWKRKILQVTFYQPGIFPGRGSIRRMAEQMQLPIWETEVTQAVG